MAVVRSQYEKEDDTETVNGMRMVNEAADEWGVTYGTKGGKIYTTLVASEEKRKSQLICQVSFLHKDLSPAKHEKISSLVGFRDDTHLLVATSLGRLLIVNLNLNKVVQDLTATSSLTLEPITSLYMSHKLYTLHQTYVVEWSIELQRPLGYYSYPNPYSVLSVQHPADLHPKLLLCGGSQTVHVHGSNGDSEFETSLLSVHVGKEINGKIVLGGSNAML